MMREPTSVYGIVLLAVGALPVAAASCPYIRGNNVQDGSSHHARSDTILEARYSEDGPNFGRCSMKSNLAGGGTRSRDWWPCELSLDVLRQNADRVNPLGADFDYATEFAKLDGACLSPFESLLYLQFCWGNRRATSLTKPSGQSNNSRRISPSCRQTLRYGGRPTLAITARSLFV